MDRKTLRTYCASCGFETLTQRLHGLSLCAGCGANKPLDERISGMDRHHTTHYVVHALMAATVVIIVLWVMYFHEVPVVLQ